MGCVFSKSTSQARRCHGVLTVCASDLAASHSQARHEEQGNLAGACRRLGVLLYLAGVRGRIVECGQGELRKADALSIVGACARYGVPSGDT